MADNFSTTAPLLTLSRGLTIRPLLHSDAATMVQSADNIKIARNMTNRFPSPYTTDSAHAFLATVRDRDQWRTIRSISDPAKVPAQSIQETGDGVKAPCHWAIALNGGLIGAVGFMFQKDVQERTAELGYWIAEDHWGKGFVTEAVAAMLAWGWQAYPEMDRVEAGVYSWNPASTSVLRKLGFAEEGRRRAAVFRMGKRCDMVLFGMVREGLEESPNTPPDSNQPKPSS